MKESKNIERYNNKVLKNYERDRKSKLRTDERLSKRIQKLNSKLLLSQQKARENAGKENFE
jgi:hypothetical protein